ncbi:Outer membrane protein OmpA [Catalinimonas alkaloidigena]|uniref:Outer membrane protein OmpA n=1 Tax=Catalinimonas alkaloidigena TaxID=1075417 RepID=A0A1G9H6X3_9BACT|nr:OmpA family protein [Catalinimonas alkaloidigena]SDL08514.1 Outer membrane protein OmpA [Catalinimonas alkaloidigena]
MRILLFVVAGLWSTLAVAQPVQWASRVIAFSSEFVYKDKPGQYHATQALGAPSVMPNFGASGCAWTFTNKNSTATEFIEVGFAHPQPVQQIFINENLNAGAITRVFVKDEKGKSVEVFYEPNPAKIEGGRLLTIRCERTGFDVHAVRVELNAGAVPDYNQIDAIGIADHQEAYQIAINLPAQLPALQPEHLGDHINSGVEELLPVISPDGATLYFVRQEKGKNQEIWKSNYKNGTFEKSEYAPAPLNTAANNAVLSVTPDGQSLLLLNRYKEDGTTENGISISRKQADGWGFPQPVEIDDYYNDSKYGEYSLANSGDVIIMTVQRKDGVAGKDMYYSLKQENGHWSAPVNLGPVVNTADDESSPFLASDNRTLYYATSGLPGYGSKDMFMTRRLGDGWAEWSEPVNLGPSINSAAWNAYYTITADGAYAYYVSYDVKENGADIFRAPLPQALRPQPIVLVSGVVSDQKTGLPLATDISYYSLQDGQEMGRAASDPQTGAYSIVLPAEDSYGFSAQEEGYLSVYQNLDLRNISQYTEKTVDLELVPIEKGAKITLRNIYFETDKYELRPESFVELNQLARILKTNPKISVEIAGHTDSQGADAYNQQLSKQRAAAVRAYLLKQGVTEANLQSIGYGETRPLVGNDTEAGRQQNRRVEFIVLEVD